MEILIIKGRTPLRQSDRLIQQLQNMGYVYFDPEHYYAEQQESTFNQLTAAKQFCLQDAINSAANGVPAVIQGDFLAAKDLQQIKQAGCELEYLDADTAAHGLVDKLRRLRFKNNTPLVSEHWLGFKLFQLQRAS